MPAPLDLSHKPKAGNFTFELEGQEGGTFHSRKPHWPGGASGVTIGRGYDMKERGPIGVKADLIAVGVDEKTASALASGARLLGPEARKFVESKEIAALEITPEQQKALFERIWAVYEADTRRLCEKDDVQAAYGKCTWKTLPQEIRDVLADMRYRGDYSPATRKVIQSAAAKGDLKAFRDAVDSLTGVKAAVPGRHKARLALLDAAIDKVPPAAAVPKSTPVKAPARAGLP